MVLVTEIQNGGWTVNVESSPSECVHMCVWKTEVFGCIVYQVCSKRLSVMLFYMYIIMKQNVCELMANDQL